MRNIKNENIGLAAICGLYCGSCTLYIISQEEPERLKTIAEKHGVAPKDLMCEGCRSSNTCPHCTKCGLRKCAEAQEIDFCIDCKDYPCEELRQFQADKPHRIELWEDLERIQAVGSGKWLNEVKEKYMCTECKTINSAYNIKCRKCGNTPSCKFVELYYDEIKKNKLEL